MVELKTLEDIDWKGLGRTDAGKILSNDELRNGKIALFPSTIMNN